jgi:exodeoxyribonuclease V gamma subunit
MLHIHRAERADGLVEALGGVVAEPLGDAMATEIVAVPTRGVERWVTQRLSARLGASPGRADGVCANIEFPFPGRLVGGAVAAATGVDRDSDPWLPERSVWPLLDVVDACLEEPWLVTLAAHLGGASKDPDPMYRKARRFGVVRHVADLYDRYAVHRPEMLRGWAGGHDTDGAGGALPSEAVWQAELWRRLREQIGQASPAERLAGACQRLQVEPGLVDLPDRLSLFGLTRLPASYLDVLRALAVGRDVHLFLLHPSPVLWERIADAPKPRTILRRAEDPTAELPSHPLLASWGQDAREMQLVLTASAATTPVQDDHRPVKRDPDPTLLQRIQADIRADRPPAGLPMPGEPDSRPPLDRDDRSLQVHSCHGRARQVEVVRDAILHLLAEDPTLEARDVIVMCPDIEAFAPLVHATFGAADVNDDEAYAALPDDARPPDLRVRLADRSLRQTNPVLGVVSELLDLADARLTGAQVLDLASREPVRRRFRLDDDDLARVEEWVADTGVRWGLDGAHRGHFGLDGLEANTWRAGVDRMLLGVAMADENQRLIGETLPLDDVGSGDIDLAGRLAELIDRLQATLLTLTEQKTIGAWAEAVARAADALTATSPGDAWQGAQLQRILDDVVTEASFDGVPNAIALSLPEIRTLLTDRLRGRPTRANFRTGHLTVCTLVPMRSVPHRVVCLLGLDDGSFPRRTAIDGDDLVSADAWVGDRDPRSEDRQLLLDALLAATDHLVITYNGRDERTNAERPPAVPVGELLDVVDRTVCTGEPRTGARSRVVLHHPLQPFDARNFTVGALVPQRAWSFDAVALEGAVALTGARHRPELFLPAPLPDAATDPAEVDQLVRFVQHPVKAFLRQRLNVSLTDRAEDASQALPVELGGLEKWGVGDRLLEGHMAGADLDACVAAEMARGTLPPGALATRVLDQVRPTVEALAAEAAARRAEAGAGAAEAHSVEVNLRLPGGRSLVGTIPGVSRDLLLTVTYSSVAPKHRLATWVRFLALTAAHPDRRFQAATVGRRRMGGLKRATVTTARLGPLGDGDGDGGRDAALALDHLAVLVDLYDRGLREPLPLYCATSAAWAAAIATGNDPESAAAAVWDSGYKFDGEAKDLEHQLVLGGVRAFADLLEAKPAKDEDGDGWDSAEPTRLGRLALRLWDGLLASEVVLDR